jgi:parallel beta-helix repeat protein
MSESSKMGKVFVMSGNSLRCLGSLILVIFTVCIVSVSAQPITAPVVITSPGMYELTADARGITDMYGIKVESSDVVIDGQGFFLGGDQRDKSVGVYVNKYGGSITNVTIKNLKLEDWNTAVSYQYVKGEEGDQNEISNLDIIDCPTGIHIEYSDVITIFDNMIRDCSKAINIEQNSNLVTLKKNNLKNNGVGVIVMKTTDVSLIENNVNTCEVYGIQVTDSTGFSMTKNNVSDNKYAALQLENSENSVIVDNNFSKTETGPVVVIGNGVRGAEIYNNYFGSVNNISVDDISSDISWNTTLDVGVNILGGPYKGGNYWGSAPGLSGFSDDVADEDGYGIGDTPYEINAYNIDYLPLTNTDKNYPAPTPEPEVVVISESEGDVLPEANGTQSDTDNSTVNESVISEQIEENLLIPVNITGTSDVNYTTNNSSYSPSISVQNEYNGEESVFSALNTSVVQVRDGQGNVSENVTVQNETISSLPLVKNGYLFFTGLSPGYQVSLLTTVNTEVVLDEVPTSSLSVPVPADVPLYTSWKVQHQNQTLATGTIDRYPAADETVVINISVTDSGVTPEAIEVSSVNQASPAILEVSNETAPVLVQIGNRTDTVENNTTPFLVVPPALTYLPKTTDVAKNTTSSGSIVMMNKANGEMVPGYTVTAYAGPGGAIFPEGSVEVMEKENVTFVLTPYEGHEIDYLLIDGSTVEPATEYQFINVTRDHTIIAGFT